MGESVHQFVIRQRVEAAKQLLNQDTLTLPEVAVQVGFADQSHLGRHCKALLGVTPQMLRKERKNLPNPGKNQRDATKGTKYTVFCYETIGRVYGPADTWQVWQVSKPSRSATVRSDQAVKGLSKNRVILSEKRLIARL